MKIIILSLAMAFLFFGCGGQNSETSFASLGDVPEELESAISSVASTNDKVGRRKNKKGVEVKLEVGGKDLKRVKLVKKHVAILEIALYEEKTEPVDILFYVAGKTETCLKGFIEEVSEEGFLPHLGDLDWNIAISLSSKKPKLIVLETNGRKAWKKIDFLKYESVYILKKSEQGVEKGEKLFIETLTSVIPEYKKNDSVQSSRYDPTRNMATRNPLPAKDFMESVETLLKSSKAENFLREDAKLYLVVIDYEHFPYYTAKEWKAFYKKYPQLNIVFLSSRRVNVSNFSHVLNQSKLSFDWLPMCNREGISQELIQTLLN